MSMASLANTVPIGGYDCEFVEPPPSAFQVDCAICLLKLRDPQQVSCCGKNFCDPCIKYLQSWGQQCPTCNSLFTTFANKGLKQSLTQLHVYCTHHSDGCEWTGELGQLDKHLNENFAPGSEGLGCPFVGIRCIHCNKQFQRQSHRFESCPKRQVRCQYYNQGCRWRGEIGELEQHVKTKCTHVIVNCTFNYAGCEIQLPRKDMPSHMAENVGDHLRILGVQNQKLSVDIASKDSHIKRLNKKLEEKVKMLWFMITTSAVIILFITCVIGSSIASLQGQCHAIESNVMSLQGQFYNIEANITSLQQQHCTIKTPFLQVTPHETPVCDSQPYQHAGDQEKVNQPPVQGDEKHILQLQEMMEEEMDQFISHLHRLRWIVAQIIAIPTTLAAGWWLVNKLRRLVNPYSGCWTSVPFTISLHNFEKYRSSRTPWYSRPFWTHFQGYKMRLRVDADGNGCGTGTHISVTTCLMQGEFDNNLKWPFRGNITVQLLDQEGVEGHRTEVISYTDTTPDTAAGRASAGCGSLSVGWGKILFIPHSELTPKYLRDNCLQFRVLKVKLN